MIAMEKWVLETNINIVDAYYQRIRFVQYFVESDFSTSLGGFELKYFWLQPFKQCTCVNQKPPHTHTQNAKKNTQPNIICLQ